MLRPIYCYLIAGKQDAKAQATKAAKAVKKGSFKRTRKPRYSVVFHKPKTLKRDRNPKYTRIRYVQQRSRESSILSWRNSARHCWGFQHLKEKSEVLMPICHVAGIHVTCMQHHVMGPPWRSASAMPKMDIHAVLKYPLTTESAMKKIEDNNTLVRQ